MVSLGKLIPPTPSVGGIFSLLFFLLVFQVSGASSTSYTIQAGDTLYSISRKLGLPVGDLMASNSGIDLENIRPGQVLKLSSSSKPEPSHPKETPTSKTEPKREKETVSGKWQHPLLHPSIKPEKNFLALPYAPHKGVEFPPSDRWNTAHSVHEGRVVAIDYMDGYGNYAILEHPGKTYSVYANLDKIFVTEGQTVQSKEKIATIQKKKGLYFQIHDKEKPIPPSFVKD